jgi:hypothetical protein
LIKPNDEYPAQYMYCKVNNNKISLCNADGDVLDQQKIFLESNNDYYNLKVSEEQTEFKITGKEKEAQAKTPKVEIDTDNDNAKYVGDLEENRTCGYWSSTETKDSYQFMYGKYKSFEVDVRGDAIEGADKITDLNSFSLVDENQEGFGSYKNFFTTPHQENLGINEKTYKEVFAKVMQEKEDKTDKLVRVKYKKGNKFYYAPMYMNIEKK